jgi:hypothetical protein
MYILTWHVYIYIDLTYIYIYIYIDLTYIYIYIRLQALYCVYSFVWCMTYIYIYIYDVWHIMCTYMLCFTSAVCSIVYICIHIYTHTRHVSASPLLCTVLLHACNMVCTMCTSWYVRWCEALFGGVVCSLTSFTYILAQLQVTYLPRTVISTATYYVSSPDAEVESESEHRGER